MGEQCDQSALLLMVCGKTIEIHVKNSVGIEQEKILTEPQFEQRARITERRFLDKIVKRDPQSAAITEVFADLLMHMGNSQNDICKSLVPERHQFPLQDRLSADRDQGFGDIRKQGGNTGPASACHDHGLHCAHSSFILLTGNGGDPYTAAVRLYG